jgi:hypothetical protein
MKNPSWSRCGCILAISALGTRCRGRWMAWICAPHRCFAALLPPSTLPTPPGHHLAHTSPAPHPPTNEPQLSEAHDEVVKQVFEPVREAWREMLRDRPWEALMHFFHAVDWKVRPLMVGV